MSIQMRKNEAKPKRKQGFAMLFVLAFAAVVIVFTAAMGSQATYNLRLASTRGQSDRAYYAANTGTQVILALLREPPEPTDPDMLPLGLPTEWSWLANDCSAIIPLPSSNSDAFAHLYHNIQGFANAQTEGPDGTPIAPDNFYIISVGVVNGDYDGSGELIGGVRYEQATMGATLAPSFPILSQAAFSFDELNIDGRIDHFNSGDVEGPYNIASDATLETFPEASIGTESKDPAKVKLYTDPDAGVDPDQRIFGNVLLGHLADGGDLSALAGALAGLDGGGPAVGEVHQYARPGVDTYGTAGAKVTGRVDKLPAPKTVLNMDATLEKIEQVFPPGHAAMSGLQLKEGKLYKYQQDLVINGSTPIEVLDDNGDGIIGDAILLVEGNITFDGANQVNRHHPPRRLKIYSLNTYDADGDGKSKLEVKNNSEIFCLVAGRDMEIEIDGTSEVWGAVLGDRVSLQPGGVIHYDVALRDPVQVAGVYGFTIGNSTIVTGVGVALTVLGAPATGGDTGTGTGTSGTGTSGTGTSGTTTTGGCGCGCGGGSMLMMQKELN